jgi:hypothetical protein
MARLQITIDDETSEILNSSIRPDLKRFFIEHAIKAAVKNPEICEIFGLTDRTQLSVPAKAKLSVMNVIQVANNRPAATVTIDDEFSDE